MDDKDKIIQKGEREDCSDVIGLYPMFMFVSLVVVK